jgi:hypothetical protein
LPTAEACSSIDTPQTSTTRELAMMTFNDWRACLLSFQ